MPTEAVPKQNVRPRGQRLDLFELQQKQVPELKEMAESYGLVELGALRKHELIFEILRWNGRLNGTMFGRGVVVRDIPGRNLIRASCGWWTSEEDIEQLLEALDGN